jgi:YgiT-type zinc finger domain-containing protein
MVTRCYLCGGKTEHRLITAENWWGDKLMLVENVPAWVCENCGEAYLDGEVCLELDRMWESPPPLDRKLEVPVYLYPGKDGGIPATGRTFRAKPRGEASGKLRQAGAGG